MHRKFFDSLPSRLRKLYEESGESQEVLANKLNLRRQSVNAWTVGKSKPDIDQLVEIANHFNVSIDWLLGMPNAPKELNADKAQIMAITKLSEEAINNLINSCVNSKQAVEALLSVPDFSTLMSDINAAINFSNKSTSDMYYCVPHVFTNDLPSPEELSAVDNGSAIIIETHSIIRSFISDSMELLRQQMQTKILNNLPSINQED